MKKQNIFSFRCRVAQPLGVLLPGLACKVELQSAMIKLFCLILALLSHSLLHAAGRGDFDASLANVDKPTVVIRIYSQVLSFTLPKGFTLGRRAENEHAFSQGFKLVGEAEDAWTQNILLLGVPGAAGKEKPLQLVTNILKLTFKNSCPKYYSVTDVGEMKIQTGESAFVFMVGCGITKPVEQSDTNKRLAMTVVIKGSSDVYVMQWLEQSSTDKVPSTQWPVWRARLDTLLPLQLQ